jgi:hypothetical protein
MSSTQQQLSLDTLHSHFNELAQTVSTLVEKVDGLTKNIAGLKNTNESSDEIILTNLGDIIARIESIRSSIPAPKTTKKAATAAESTTETVQEASSDKKTQASSQTLFKTSYAIEHMNKEIGETIGFLEGLQKRDGHDLHENKYKNDEAYRTLYNNKKQELGDDLSNEKEREKHFTFHKFVGASIYSEMSKTDRAAWKAAHEEYARKLVDDLKNEPEEPEAKPPRKKSTTTAKAAPSDDEEPTPKPAARKPAAKRKPATKETEPEDDEEVAEDDEVKSELPKKKEPTKRTTSKK